MLRQALRRFAWLRPALAVLPASPSSPAMRLALPSSPAMCPGFVRLSGDAPGFAQLWCFALASPSSPAMRPGFAQLSGGSPWLRPALRRCALASPSSPVLRLASSGSPVLRPGFAQLWRFAWLWLKFPKLNALRGTSPPHPLVSLATPREQGDGEKSLALPPAPGQSVFLCPSGKGYP